MYIIIWRLCRMKNIMINLSLILLIGLFLTQCAKQGEDVIVEVGDQIISSDDVKNLLASKFPEKENFNYIELDKKKELLKPLITKSLNVNKAYALGLDKDNKYQQLLEDQQMKLMGTKYYEVTIIDEIVPESEIEKAITRQGEEVKASHILIGFRGTRGRGASQRSRDEAVELANEILDQLREGADFGTTAVKYSEDPSAKKNQGDLGYRNELL